LRKSGGDLGVWVCEMEEKRGCSQCRIHPREREREREMIRVLGRNGGIGEE